tara:strand:- start:772 stop:1131 length:360 start_codon:yes stop_codon:yes gene_type:complete
MLSLYNNTNVLELTFDDFKDQQIINPVFKNKNGLVSFYAPWCIHCKKMRDKWIELADNFNNRFVISAINIEDFTKGNDKLLYTFKVKKYPTFFFIKNNKLIPYTEKNIDNMVYYIWNNL